ncbi:sporulation protein YunB [Paenibacillus xylaniclasticus]|uniref:sporulation protein YunB n=1 Tax=Paenibacillus xylaniclasticus TaxID=588083 RepID=UPI00157F92D9|nr:MULTISPECIES: sporulation protein YunB [Paenibacillus]
MARWGRRPLWGGRIRTVRFQPSSKIRTAKPARPFRRRPALFSGVVRQGGRPKRWSGGSRRVTSSGSRGGGIRLRKRTVLLILLMLFISSAALTASYIDRHLRPPLMNVAGLRVKQIATQSINRAISEQVASHSNSEKLVEWKTNTNGKISGFMLNYAEHMRITSETIDTVQRTLKELGSIPEHIPIGQAVGSTFLSSYGPRVPVKFEPIGSVKVDLNTRQQNAGINMILVEVYIRIEAEVSIIIPFDTKPEVVSTNIPISYLLVVGDVPMYYYDNKGRPVGDSAGEAPNIAIPGLMEQIETDYSNESAAIQSSEPVMEHPAGE